MPIPDSGTDASCALPNLSVDVDAMVKTAMVTTVIAGKCEVEEACADDGGLRKVLRFEVTIPNNGAADLVLGDPDGSTSFEYGACHMHYHFTDFARYSLLNDAGTIVSKARKQAFCARDDIRNDPNSPDAAKYDCQNQGITRGWSDKYSALLPCQWLDISDLPPGNYTLEVEVNPNRKMTELDYTDNIARIPVTILP